MPYVIKQGGYLLFILVSFHFAMISNLQKLQKYYEV